MEKNSMRRGGSMMMNKCFILLFCLMGVTVYAQDPIPDMAALSLPMEIIEPNKAYGVKGSSVLVGNSLPDGFIQSTENIIEDEGNSLLPFFEKLMSRKEIVRIVHIGDSHIRGHLLTKAVRHNFERDFGDQAVYKDSISYFTSGLARETGNPGIVYHAYGINGATTTKFANSMQMYEMAQLQPDLVIISFGTNESHSRNYNVASHIKEMDELLAMLKQYLPECSVLLTTPPGSYTGPRKKKVVNTRTSLVAKTIVDYARQRNIAYWDLYRIAGGEKASCLNWLNSDSFQRDRIHFTDSGYQLQGNLLYEAIIKSYNAYVGD